MNRSALAVTWLLVAGSISFPCARAADAGNSDLDRRFARTVRPFVTTYCAGCHSGASPAAQFDLTQYSTLAAVVRDYPHWNLAMERLTAKEMPPKVAPQPPDAARQQVIEWIQAVRKNEARKSAGDPGTVLAEAFEQRRIQLHHSRSHRPGHASHAGVSGGSGQSRGLR